MFRQGIKWVVPSASERAGKSESNEWFMFRNQVEATAEVDGILRICADSKYWLYVNGELIVREGGLKRGPVPDACPGVFPSWIRIRGIEVFRTGIKGRRDCS